MVGIGLSVVAYLPQVSHVAKERCSAGVSSRAWAMWLTSSLLVGALAVYRRDYVFISLAASGFLSSRPSSSSLGDTGVWPVAPTGTSPSSPRPDDREPRKPPPFHDPPSPRHNPPKECSIDCCPTTRIGN